MNAIKVNIQTGEVTHTKIQEPKHRDLRYCLWCDRQFEVTSATGTKYCSDTCIQHLRLTDAVVTAVTKTPVEIVPEMEIKNRVKSPRFVKNHYQWAIQEYGKYVGTGRQPNKKTEEWILYKYGEWLFNNQTYSTKDD